MLLPPTSSPLAQPAMPRRTCLPGIVRHRQVRPASPCSRREYPPVCQLPPECVAPPDVSVTKSPPDYNWTPASTGTSCRHAAGTSSYRAARTPRHHLHLRLGGV